MDTHGATAPARPAPRGFTLIEVLLAITIGAFLVVAILELFNRALFSKEELKALSEPMTVGPRILDMIEEDLESLWTYNIKEEKVLLGQDRDFSGVSADRLHLLTTGRTTFDVRLDNDEWRRVHLAEVSYVLRSDETNPDLLQLWRREDPLLDEDMTRGGEYQLLSDRVRSFNIRYFEEIGREAEPLDEWDSSESGNLPRRIHVEMVLERRPETFNVLRSPEVEDVGGRTLRFERNILIPPEMTELAGVGLLPVVPEGPPEAENALAGGGGPGRGPGGAADPRNLPDGGRTTGRPGDRPARGGDRPSGRPGLPGFPGTGGKPPGNIGDLLRRMGGGGKGGSGGGRKR